MATIVYGSSKTVGVGQLSTQNIALVNQGRIFTPLQPKDYVTDNKQIVTETVWSNNSGSITTYFTSSTQSATQKEYYYNVYYTNPALTTGCASNIQFSVAYGNRLGSGSSDLRDDSNMIGYSPSKAIYSQYRNILLDRTKTQFTVGTTNKTTDQIIAISIARARYKQRIDPGNWELSVSGSNGNIYTFIDDYKNVESGLATENITFGGLTTNIVSGTISAGIYNSTNPVYYGKAFVDHGTLIFDGDMLYASASVSMSQTPDNNDENAFRFLTAMSGAAVLDVNKGFHVRNEQVITSTYYFVRVANQDYNFTNNPSFVTGSDGTFVHPSMFRNPKTYVTTVGLYNDTNELLAVGKLSKPILKSFESELLIRSCLQF